jgi:quinoprotein glucose dehydrogenase
MSSRPAGLVLSMLAILFGGAHAPCDASPKKPPARPTPAPYTTWSDYGGSADTMQYSALDQIDRSNVSRLAPAWTYLAPGPSPRTAYSPIVVDGVMYALGKDKAIVALDAATGVPVWSHPTQGDPTARGINYWESRDRSERRLFFCSEHWLQAIDARTGENAASFGKDGRVDLREGLPRAATSRNVESGTPGRVFEDLLILGTNVGEEYDAPPGDLRAFDVRTGKVVWTFHTIPRPGEYGYDTWPPDAWTRNGGANAWGEISVDEKRGIAYFPLGSPTYDLYGANREGTNLFGNCLLALDARTGKRLWHFQAVHHDLWDYDLTAAPKLMTVTQDGKKLDIVAQATKSGFVYVFDRVTGAPVWPIEERPVPKSDMVGEHAWPTQPFPLKPPPFSRQKLTPEDMNPYIDGAEAERVRDLFAKLRHEGVFTPPGRRGTMAAPGQYGGANFAACAADPETGMLYVRGVDAPTFTRLRSSRPPEFSAEDESGPARRGMTVYRRSCVSCHGFAEGPPRSPSQMGKEAFRQVLKEGKGQMPAFPDMSLEDADTLAAFLDMMMGRRSHERETDVEDEEEAVPSENGEVRYFGQFGHTLDTRNGLPIVRPPWSEIVAYDLNEGTIKWRVPLGTVPQLAAKGIKDTGSYRPTRNGPVVTKGGLIFVGTRGDFTVRAFDKASGAVLWEHEMDGDPEGIPAVYELGGRQYVVFYVGGRRKGAGPLRPGTSDTQGYYAFALPQETGH